MAATKQHDDGPASALTNKRRPRVAGLFEVEVWPQSRRFGMAAAVLAVLAGLAVRFAFLGALGDTSAYATFYPAVAIAAILAGFSAAPLQCS